MKRIIIIEEDENGNEIRRQKIPYTPSWQDGYSLDRINPNKDYSPENCRWATNRQQQRNRRNNRREPCIRQWEGKYYVQVEKNGVHRRRLCDTLELAISVRDAFDKELDKIWF